MNPEVIFYPRTAIEQAVEKFPTPFFLYNEKRIRDNCQRFKTAFTNYFPDFQPLYAVKANNNPEIVKIILNEGFNLDTSSESEVWLGNKLGATGMFTGNYNPAEELKYAKDCGFILNLDDASMLSFLPEIGVPEFLSFRINPGISEATIESNLLAGPNAKYGIPFEKAAEAYKQARDLGVKRFGIHMMTGSNVPIEKQDYFADITRKLFEIIADIKNKTGIEIELMNIGGGFGVPYRPEERSLDLNELAKSVRTAFDESIVKYNLRAPKLMAEPGRYMTADAGFLIGKVTVIKDGYKKFVGIDASSADMPRPSIYGAYHHASVINNASEKTEDLETVSIVGRICENNDQLAQNRSLPKINIGDIVVIHNCGGHAYVMGHNYNGRLRHAEYLLGLNNDFRQIRRAETIDDLFATTKLN